MRYNQPMRKGNMKTPQQNFQQTNKTGTNRNNGGNRRPSRINNNSPKSRPQSRSRSKSQKRLYSQVVRDGIKRRLNSSVVSKRRQINGQNQNRQRQGRNKNKRQYGATSQTKRKFQNNGNRSARNTEQATNERYIHFLEVRHQTPERDKESEETQPKELHA